MPPNAAARSHSPRLAHCSRPQAVRLLRIATELFRGRVPFQRSFQRVADRREVTQRRGAMADFLVRAGARAGVQALEPIRVMVVDADVDYTRGEPMVGERV